MFWTGFGSLLNKPIYNIIGIFSSRILLLSFVRWIRTVFVRTDTTRTRTQDIRTHIEQLHYIFSQWDTQNKSI